MGIKYNVRLTTPDGRRQSWIGKNQDECIAFLMRAVRSVTDDTSLQQMYKSHFLHQWPELKQSELVGSIVDKHGAPKLLTYSESEVCSMKCFYDFQVGVV